MMLMRRRKRLIDCEGRFEVCRGWEETRRVLGECVGGGASRLLGFALRTEDVSFEAGDSRRYKRIAAFLHVGISRHSHLIRTYEDFALAIQTCRQEHNNKNSLDILHGLGMDYKLVRRLRTNRRCCWKLYLSATRTSSTSSYLFWCPSYC